MSIDQNAINELKIEMQQDKIKVYRKLRKLISFFRWGAIWLLVCSILSTIGCAVSAYVYDQNVMYAVISIILVIASIGLIRSLTSEIDDCDYNISAANSTIKKIRSTQYQ